MTQQVDGKTQMPVRRKMLFIVDDPDSIINICHRVNNPRSRQKHSFLEELGYIYLRKFDTGNNPISLYNFSNAKRITLIESHVNKLKNKLNQNPPS